MPLYEFLCRDCQVEQEQLVRNTDTPTCQSCGSERLVKLLSVPAAHAGDGESRSQGPAGPCGHSCGCFPQ